MAAWLDGDNVTVPAYFSFEPLFAKLSRNYPDDTCTSYKVGQEVHTEHLSILGRGLWLTSLFRSAIFCRGQRCCPFHNAHDGDTAIYYQGVPCLS